MTGCPGKSKFSIGIHPVLSAFAVHAMGCKGPTVSTWGQWRLIWLGRCPDWSGRTGHLLILPNGGSYMQCCRWDQSYRTIFHYENTPIQIYWKFNHQKTENFQTKNSDIFRISAHNIDCVYSLEPPRRGGSNEYPQSMFLSRIKKNNVYSCEPQFYYITVGFKGVKHI